MLLHNLFVISLSAKVIDVLTSCCITRLYIYIFRSKKIIKVIIGTFLLLGLLAYFCCLTENWQGIIFCQVLNYVYFFARYFVLMLVIWMYVQNSLEDKEECNNIYEKEENWKKEHEYVSLQGIDVIRTNSTRSYIRLMFPQTNKSKQHLIQWLNECTPSPNKPTYFFKYEIRRGYSLLTLIDPYWC